MDGSPATTARQMLPEHFRWHDGHADVWRVFGNPMALAAVVRDLVRATGADLIGLSLMVDQLAAAREQLPPVYALVKATELPPYD